MLRHIEGPETDSLTFQQVMKALSIGKETLRSLIARRVFPDGVRLGGAKRWPWLDVVAFLHLAGRLTLPSEDAKQEEKVAGRKRPPESV